ncbi:MAG: hypothetical protein ACD_47C00124G0002 [uncultured bacterium]|nr:MAG: hypothetical protein ACD_47C00124G0002 [uncultured bacterium]
MVALHVNFRERKLFLDVLFYLVALRGVAEFEQPRVLRLNFQAALEELARFVEIAALLAYLAQYDQGANAFGVVFEGEVRFVLGLFEDRGVVVLDTVYQKGLSQFDVAVDELRVFLEDLSELDDRLVEESGLAVKYAELDAYPVIRRGLADDLREYVDGGVDAALFGVNLRKFYYGLIVVRIAFDDLFEHLARLFIIFSVLEYPAEQKRDLHVGRVEFQTLREGLYRFLIHVLLEINLADLLERRKIRRVHVDNGVVLLERAIVHILRLVDLGELDVSYVVSGIEGQSAFEILDRLVEHLKRVIGHAQVLVYGYVGETRFESLVVYFDGVRVLVLAHVCVAQTQINLRIFRLELYYLLEFVYSAVVLAADKVYLAKPEMRVCGIRVFGDDLFKRFLGLRHVSAGKAQIAEFLHRVCALITAMDSLFKHLQRAVDVAFGLVYFTQRKISVFLVRFRFEDLTEARFRGAVIFTRVQQHSGAHIRFDVVGLKPENRFERFELVLLFF